MARLSGIHWQAPSTVIFALFAGALFAVGHHLFYNNLDGQSAPNDSYTFLGSSVSSQQINIAGGTAFAFLVKACLATAIGAAYAQLFWRAMLHRTPELNLQRLDATFSALTNVHHLFKVWTWWRYPILFSLALIAWLIPIASIVTPATLSIRSAAEVPPLSRSQNVPNLDFVNLNYLNYMSSGHTISTTDFPDSAVQYFYNGPSRAVTSIAEAVAASGSILKLQHPALNSSYTLNFVGPSLQCSNIPNSLLPAIRTNIARAGKPSGNICTAYGFLGWTPASSYDGNVSAPLPFAKTSNSSFELNSAALTGGTPGTVYLAAMPEMMISQTVGSSHQILGACIEFSSDVTSTVPFANSTFLQCDLHNSTYKADFTFINGEQEISVDVTPFSQGPMMTTFDAWGPSLYPSLGTIASKPDCSPLNVDNTTCQFNSTHVSTLAYQAVFEAFNALFVGSVAAIEGSSAATFSTGVQDTVVIETPELAFLEQPTSAEGLVSLQQSVLNSNGTLYRGIYKNQTSETRKPLSTAMEDLFKNIVISLMTSRKLQPDPTSAFAPPATNVTIYNYHNVYTYSAWKLWLAYGLAIFFASICALVGLITVAANQASYSLGFSTVLRASKCAYTNVQLTEDDADIRDPLPPHLVKAKIWLGSPPQVPDKTQPPANNARDTETRNGDSGCPDRDSEPTHSNGDANAAEASSMLLRPQPNEQQDAAHRTDS